jgi:c-di-GMP-binding flagellar brake protein YcgR
MQRKYPRMGTDFRVDCSVGDETLSTRAMSLGGGGLFLGITQRLDQGTELLLRFRPSRTLPLMEARAVVRYQLPDKGVGIEFTEIKPEHRQRILNLIYRRMGEKRRHPRAPLVAQVEHAGGTFIGFSRDISAGGMFIESTETLAPGARLKLRFYLDSAEPIAETTAQAMYTVQKLGTGVQFLDLSPDARARIEAYVAKSGF